VALQPAPAQPPAPQIPPESGPNCLELPPETVLSVPHGLTVSETSNGRKT
jgi:hypothetical protein